MRETLQFTEQLDSPRLHVEAAPLGHASTLASLFRENNRSLCAYLRMRVPSRCEAEDIAQEAYARLLQHERPRAISYLRAYLFKVAANIASDHARRRRLQLRVDLAHSSKDQIESESPDQQLHASEQLSLLAQSLSELPEKYQRAFLLCRVHEWPTPQIAADLGVGERMARHYVSRSARYCRLRLEGMAAPDARREVIP